MKNKRNKWNEITALLRIFNNCSYKKISSIDGNISYITIENGTTGNRTLGAIDYLNNYCNYRYRIRIINKI